MGHKSRRSPPVRVELDLDLRGSVTVVLDEDAADRLGRLVMKGSVPLREFGIAVDWNDVAVTGDGGFVLGCEAKGRLS